MATPPVLSYHSGTVLRDATKAFWLLIIAASELVVLSLISVFAAAEAGVQFRV